MTAPTDPYVAAKASLRDNVKTLIAVFGGIAGVLLAGTPFSGYGELEIGSCRWVIASLALPAALGLLAWSVWKLLIVLRPDLTYASLLSEDPKDQTSDPEIQAVRDEFGRRKAELLPKFQDGRTMASVKDLTDAKSAAWKLYQQDRSNAANKEGHDRLADALALINHWSAFTRLHERIARGIRAAFLLGLPTIFLIAAFALASAPGKEKDKPSVQIIKLSGIDEDGIPAPRVQPVPLPLLKPVLFATGKADLTEDGVTRIAAARDFLRTHFDVGLLVYASTDTVGGEADNQQLSDRRAARVAGLLRSEGGVAASRVFIASLARTDLPALTERQKENAANRSVEMVLIPLAKRGG